MFHHQTKLTTVKVLKDKYYEFQAENITESGITLQALVNRSIYLYNRDADFKKKIDDTNDLKVSGSKL
jgi:hypothetical protein